MLCSAHNQSVLFLTLVHNFRGFSITSFHNQSSYYSPTGTDTVVSAYSSTTPMIYFFPPIHDASAHVVIVLWCFCFCCCFNFANVPPPMNEHTAFVHDSFPQQLT